MNFVSIFKNVEISYYLETRDSKNFQNIKFFPFIIGLGNSTIFSISENNDKYCIWTVEYYDHSKINSGQYILGESDKADFCWLSGLPIKWNAPKMVDFIWGMLEKPNVTREELTAIIPIQLNKSYYQFNLDLDNSLRASYLCKKSDTVFEDPKVNSINFEPLKNDDDTTFEDSKEIDPIIEIIDNDQYICSLSSSDNESEDESESEETESQEESEQSEEEQGKYDDSSDDKSGGSENEGDDGNKDETESENGSNDETQSQSESEDGSESKSEDEILDRTLYAFNADKLNIYFNDTLNENNNYALLPLDGFIKQDKKNTVNSHLLFEQTTDTCEENNKLPSPKKWNDDETLYTLEDNKSNIQFNIGYEIPSLDESFNEDDQINQELIDDSQWECELIENNYIYKGDYILPSNEEDEILDQEIADELNISLNENNDIDVKYTLSPLNEEDKLIAYKLNINLNDVVDEKYMLSPSNNNDEIMNQEIISELKMDLNNKDIVLDKIVSLDNSFKQNQKVELEKNIIIDQEIMGELITDLNDEDNINESTYLANSFWEEQGIKSEENLIIIQETMCNVVSSLNNDDELIALNGSFKENQEIESEVDKAVLSIERDFRELLPFFAKEVNPVPTGDLNSHIESTIDNLVHCEIKNNSEEINPTTNVTSQDIKEQNAIIQFNTIHIKNYEPLLDGDEEINQFRTKSCILEAFDLMEAVEEIERIESERDNINEISIKIENQTNDLILKLEKEEIIIIKPKNDEETKIQDSDLTTNIEEIQSINVQPKEDIKVQPIVTLPQTQPLDNNKWCLIS